MERRTVGVMLCLIVIPLPSNRAYAQDESTIGIRIYDVVGIRSAPMDGSHLRVEAIFRQAGVRVAWRDCRTSAPHSAICDAAPLPNEAIVRLLSGAPTFSTDGCGVALVPTIEPAHFISLFVDCIRRAADRLAVREEVVLAGTLAHEIGHLLLGPQHGFVGLMQAQPRGVDWARATHDGLTFTASESHRLRQALTHGCAVGCIPERRADPRGPEFDAR